jgi:cyclase
MIFSRVIPCLSIMDDGLVKTIQFNQPSYVGDPINAIKIFNDKEVDELVLLDITASKNRTTPNFQLIKEIASECFMPLGYGGGITKLSEIEFLFQIGIEKVILNSIIHSNPSLCQKAIEIFGSQSIVASVDYKKPFLSNQYYPYTFSGTTKIPDSLIDYVKQIEELGFGEIILNSIERDGKMNGYDIKTIETLTKELSIPVVALGGANSLEDFKLALQSGASAVAAGSYFIYQPPHRAVLITYPSQEELHLIQS